MKLLTLLILNIFIINSLSALPIYRSMVKAKNGVLVNCTLCHDKESWELNGYGKDFLKEGHDFSALEKIEGNDSDKDGYINRDEWKALSNPGEAGSRPGKEGLWLKEAKPTLAPKKVLNPLFPAGVSYKIKEGMLPSALIQEVEKILERKLKDEESYPTLFWVTNGDQVLGVAAYSIFGSGHHGLSVVLTIMQGNKILKIHPVHLHTKKLGQGDALDQFVSKSSNDMDGFVPPKGLEKEFNAMKDSIRTTLLVLERCSL